MTDIHEWFEINWADITKSAPDMTVFDASPIRNFSAHFPIELRPDNIMAGGRYRWCGHIMTSRGMVWVSEMSRRRAYEYANSFWSPIL